MIEERSRVSEYALHQYEDADPNMVWSIEPHPPTPTQGCGKHDDKEKGRREVKATLYTLLSFSFSP